VKTKDQDSVPVAHLLWMATAAMVLIVVLRSTGLL